MQSDLLELDACPAACAEIEMRIFPDASCLLFGPRAQDGHVLDAFGALVWGYCNGALTAGKIAALVPQGAGAPQQIFGLILEFTRRGVFVSTANAEPRGSDG